jgi:hypothetical protein
MFEKTYKLEEIAAAHEKQRRIARGQGGVVFTPVEKEIIENHVKLPEKKGG